MKVGKVLCRDLYTFYRYWLEIICLKINTGNSDDINFPSGRQHHILTSKQMDLLAYMMRNRRNWEVEKGIKDADLLDKLTSDESGRNRIRKEMQLKSQRMYELFKAIEDSPFNILIRVDSDNGKLDYYRMNPKYVPNIAEPNKFNGIADLVIRFIKDNDEKPS